MTMLRDSLRKIEKENRKAQKNGGERMQQLYELIESYKRRKAEVKEKTWQDKITKKTIMNWKKKNIKYVELTLKKLDDKMDAISQNMCASNNKKFLSRMLRQIEERTIASLKQKLISNTNEKIKIL